jgi:hypothetical protein
MESVPLAVAFPKLKSLAVELESCDAAGGSKGSHIKYAVNIANAKSMFRFNCTNNECVRGDFDLSAVLAKAVAAKKKLVSGELICQGWRSKATIDTVRCHNVLRYKLTLGY